MENSPLDRGLTMTLTWGGGAYRVRRSLSVGAVLRVAGALALCAACYEAGRWHGNLEAQAARTSQRPLAAASGANGLAVAEPAPATAAPGKAVGDPEQDVITPLNVRDPSALVMAPYAAAAPQAAPAPAEEEGYQEAPPSPPARIFPRPDAKVKPPRKF